MTTSENLTSDPSLRALAFVAPTVVHGRLSGVGV